MRSIIKKLISMISYVFFLIALVIILDLTYAKFFERVPLLMQKVYLQMVSHSVHKRTDIPGLFYDLRPSSSNESYTINSHGMRDKEIVSLKDSYRIVVLGDSVTFGGAEIDTKDLFTEVAEKILNDSGKKVEILNCGVNGYNTKQEFIALKEKHMSLNPDMVIFAYCINDGFLSMIQYLPQDYVQKILLKEEKIDNKDAAYHSLTKKQCLALVFPKQFNIGYELDRWLLMNSGLYRSCSLMKFKNKNSIQNLKDLANFLTHKDYNLLLRNIKGFSEKHNFDLKFVILPVSVQWDRDFMYDALNESKIDFWDFNHISEEHKRRNTEVWCEDGTHLTSKGHILAGKLLAEKLSGLDFSYYEP